MIRLYTTLLNLSWVTFFSFNQTIKDDVISNHCTVLSLQLVYMQHKVLFLFLSKQSVSQIDTVWEALSLPGNIRMNVNNLSNKVLIRIFVHLTYRDRGRAQMVCSRWREVVQLIGSLPRSVKFSSNFGGPALSRNPNRMKHPFILHKNHNGRPAFKQPNTISAFNTAEIVKGACLSWTGRCWEVSGGGGIWELSLLDC